LRWELQSFVCEGAYREALERILESFLGRVGKPLQPAVWVSGFYGSGKSHLVRVLDALWRDVTLPDGASARGLVRLPDEVKAQLVELTTVGKREGGLWSAAGTLSTGVGSSVRLAVMGVVFRAAGLPEKYSQARFVSWLDAEGYRPAMDAALKASGRTLAGELKDMYVSRPLASALLAAAPGIATSEADVHKLLREQYRDVTEIGSDEFVGTLTGVLRRPDIAPSGRLPLALIILDELQQFLNDDPNRTLEVQDIVEQCSRELEGRLLFVAAGQMQLGSTPGLQKLRGRFTVEVALSDSDVDRVVRAVVLRKDPTKVAEVKATLDRASGEIARQLSGTKIAHRRADDADLVPDYPLLPVRRRLWESILRSVDSIGTAGQLRNQLRIVLEATQAVAKAPLGTVIAGDAIYDAVTTNLQESKMLPRDTATLIARIDTTTPEGVLRSRIAKLAFLLAKLEESGPLATGVRATADTFADLLVDDLTVDGSALRRHVPEIISALVSEGLLLEVDGEYVLQTPVAAEWLQAYAREVARLRNDEVWLAGERSQALKSALQEQIGRLVIPHGKSKIARKLLFAFGDSLPPATTGDIPVWVRDGWSVTAAEVIRDAQAAGTDSPVVFVFIPRQEQEVIREALAARGAATSLVTGRPAPQTEDGVQARSGISSRGQSADNRLAGVIAGLLDQARVLQGGGNEVTLGSLKASVENAAASSVIRLFPNFGAGDYDKWGSVIERAKQGSPNPLAAIGYSGDVEKQPTCAGILLWLSAGQRTGKEIRSNFAGAGYGWSQDAIDGALYALIASGLVRARLNGSTVTTSVAQNMIGSIVFQVENTVVPASVRIAVRGLASKLELPVGSLAEADIPARLLTRLEELASAAGGEAPLPASQVPQVLKDLQGLSGNEQIQKLFDMKDELQRLAESWKGLATKVAARLKAWSELETLFRYAEDSAVAGDAKDQTDAVRSSRALLVDPDPVGPLVQRLADDLRARLVAARNGYERARAASVDALSSDELWKRLEELQREQILRGVGLADQPKLRLETTTDLIAALGQSAPREWVDRVVALPGRILGAREEAARLLEPTTVSVRPPSATIRTEEDLDKYLRQLRDDIVKHLRAGNPVVL